MEQNTPSTMGASPSGFSAFSTAGLSQLLATPVLTQPTQPRTPRPKKKASINVVDACLTPTVPQKRQRVIEESEEYEFGANSSQNSVFKPSGTRFTSTPKSNAATGAIDLKRIVQDAISPLISEIKGLKEEVQQLRAERAKKTAPTASQGTGKAIEKAPKAKPQITHSAATAKDGVSKAPVTPMPGQTPTYAGILRREAAPQASTPSSAPWTLIQKKAKPPAHNLAPQKATEPSQRRLIFQRQKDAPKAANLADMLLALNKALKQWELPDHVRLLKLGYTGTGAISCLLGERAIASMVLPKYSDSLIKVAIQYDSAITGIDQAEQWYRLRVHGVLLSRYYNNPEGLRLAKKEIKATQGHSLP
jgi:hypothetical protein